MGYNDAMMGILMVDSFLVLMEVELGNLMS
jgi:hypothetical protein